MQQKIVSVFVFMAIVAVFAHPASAAGDPVAGEKVFKKCTACHSLDPAKKKIGPTLKGIIGRPAGSIEGFKYSSTYGEAQKKGLIWTGEEIVKYLENPKKYLAAYLGIAKAKSKMTARFKKIADRENVVAYLEKAAQ
ncbi:MAG: c-type cytochrome [Proteobacteria bacterium]|nr:c-type cytochrome [Pseudomonadota bacterium]